MIHNIDLIITVTGGLAAALCLGYITFRLGLSPIVGYLLAGFVVGPNSPTFVANERLAEQLAEIGVILLMFGMGLQFHLEELWKVRRVAVPGSLFAIAVAAVLGTALGVLLGWPFSSAAVYGLTIAIASTVVIMRVLADNRDLHTSTGHLAVGWLVVEDLFAVFVLVLLPAVLAPVEPSAAELARAAGFAALKLSVLVGVMLIVGERVIPWVLNQVAATRSRELFTLTVLVIALGIAVGSATLFGASMALGAFLAGTVVGRSEFSLRAATEALPMRDAFAVLFFVSVGILFDPRQFVNEPVAVAGTVAIIMLGKPLAVFATLTLLRYPLTMAVSVALAFAQIGEFSFILATAGAALGVIGPSMMSTIVAASIVTISVNPLIYRLAPRISRRLRPYFLRGASAHVAEAVIEEDEEQRQVAVVVGYGPVGRTLVELLQQNKVDPVVVELNLQTVRQLVRDGVHAVYGDATHRETLQQARVREAVGLVLTSASMHGSSETIRLARDLNPGITIYARSGYLGEVAALREAGADAVFSAEGEVALTMTEFLLRQLRATPEQVDRERERIRFELFRGRDISADIQRFELFRQDPS